MFDHSSEGALPSAVRLLMSARQYSSIRGVEEPMHAVFMASTRPRLMLFAWVMRFGESSQSEEGKSWEDESVDGRPNDESDLVRCPAYKGASMNSSMRGG